MSCLHFTAPGRVVYSLLLMVPVNVPFFPSGNPGYLVSVIKCTVLMFACSFIQLSYGWTAGRELIVKLHITSLSDVIFSLC